MKTLDIAETVKTAVPIMNRTQRLRHWASLVRPHRGPLLIFHNLEFWDKYQLAATSPTVMAAYNNLTAFALAENDPSFQAQGLGLGSTFKQHMDFFELSQMELHAFSCDCGGMISNQQMADRIERLAKT